METNNSVIVKNMDVYDIDDLVDCAMEFNEQSEFLDVDPQTFSNFCMNLHLSSMGVVICAYKNARCIGAIAGVAHQCPISGTKKALESFWFVKQKYRGMGGIRLYKAFEAWAKAMDCKSIIMVHLVDSMPEKVKRFYRSRGYRKMETNYIKEL